MKLFAALLLVPSVAAAESTYLPDWPIAPDGEAPDYGFVADTRPDGVQLARQVLPSSRSTSDVLGTVGGTTSALALSRVIYLNHTGVTLSPGDNDSRTNKSSIVTAATAFAAWNVSAQTWNETLTCFRDLFARFDVTVVDTDPGNVNHIEAVFGGSPTQVGLPTNVAGVSPFTTDCGIIENSIVFTFTGAFQMSSREACEIMAQEVAHSFGLDHELLASDPMTYLQYTGNRAFQDQTASCGESTARPCGINGSTCRANQNSVSLLKERVGTGDAIAPVLSWTMPSDNATVPPGFDVKASGSDNIALTSASLKVDGTMFRKIDGVGPYTFTTDSTLSEGVHTLIIELSDGKNIKSEMRTVTVQKGAPPEGGTGSGSSDDPLANGDIVGGCAVGGSDAGLLFALGLAGLLRRRRRH